MEEPIIIPTTEISADERAELEALRRENRRRDLSEHACSQLSARGISTVFAPFLLGEDEAATAKNVAAFERAWNNTLQAEVARRLPRQQPRDLSQPVSAPVRRSGIRKVR
jgi:hypothetical protein